MLLMTLICILRKWIGILEWKVSTFAGCVVHYTLSCKYILRE